MDEVLIGTLLGSTLRVATPLLLCALAGLLSERAGVVDIGLEGKMLLAAFAAASAGAAWGSTGLALLLAVAVTVVLSWLHGLACVSHRGDQVVSGVAINLIAAGLTVVLGIAWFGQGGQTPPVADGVRLAAVWPGAAAALGPLFGEALLGHNASWSMRRWRWCRPCGGCCTARASACGCARWARRRRWSMPRACRYLGCATPRSRSTACCAHWPGAIWCWRRMPRSCRT
jgi:hypothetical protein